MVVKANDGDAALVTLDSSPVEIRVIPTSEEITIARQVSTLMV
jgi:acetate kinase